jgi:hypothetical protein
MQSALCLGALLALGLGLAPAHAQQARSFVSSFGNDGNAPNCIRTAPCRTFQTAHNNTLPNGEITVLDPGSYGAVSINRNISIINDGVGEAGILISGGNTGVIINAAGASVTLRGLTIKGIGFGGGNGIDFLAGAALNVENCTIRNLDGPGDGIIFAPNSAAALAVTNTMITDNTINGILIQPTGVAGVAAVLDHVGLYNNAFVGLHVNGSLASGGQINVTVNESIGSNNGSPGNGAAFEAVAPANTAAANIYFIRSIAATNPANALVASGQLASVNVYQSALIGNQNGWLSVSNGSILTWQNNMLSRNVTNIGPAFNAFPG